MKRTLAPRRKIFSIVSIILLPVFFLQTSCATIVKGTSQNINIATEPSDALASVGTKQCKTPCSMQISKNSDSVQLRKDGYKDVNLQLDKKFNGVPTILGNILWLLPGVIIDFISGGAYQVEDVSISLQPENNNKN